MTIPGVVRHDGPASNGVPRPVRVMHFTHLSNIPSVLKRDGLLSHKQASIHCQADISDPGVQGKRAVKQVPIGAGGTLHEYVPLYFAELSPMLYKRTFDFGTSPGVQHQPLEFVYLVTTAREIHAAGLRYVFTNAHPLSKLAEFYAEHRDINQLHWQVLQAPVWNNDPNKAPHRRTQREAEFLVHECLPWELVTYVVVHSVQVKIALESMMTTHSRTKPIHVNPRWYYRKFADGAIRVDFAGARR